MANSRYINTQFWKDRYIVDMEKDERLLYLYLMTNPLTNIAGIYEISIREMEFDTGIERGRVEEILQKLIKDNKLTYLNGWVALHNWIKHQSINPKVVTGITRIIDSLPIWLRNDLLYDTDEAEIGLFDDSLSIGQDSLSIEHDSLKTVDKWAKNEQYSLSRPIALNLTKLNLTKPNANDAEDSKIENSKSMSPAEKKRYAQSMEKERQSNARAEAAKSRTASMPTAFAPRERKWRD